MTPSLPQFRGTWQIAREIDDRRAGATGRFVGLAEFADHDGGLRYSERGQLWLGQSAPLTAERHYVWTEDADGLHIRFEDGRPFHSIAHGAVTASHWCDPDTYNVAYDFARWPEWSATWTVAGPRKDYTMTSDYIRVA